jgi:NAD(P)-dependent dehydrogenase (short-subunit alcohol dehydrogenase family)
MLDVTSEESCEVAIDRVKKELIEKNLPLVALVNNAGVATQFPTEFHSKADTKFVFETNVFGILTLTQMALPLLRES